MMAAEKIEKENAESDEETSGESEELTSDFENGDDGGKSKLVHRGT